MPLFLPPQAPPQPAPLDQLYPPAWSVSVLATHSKKKSSNYSVYVTGSHCAEFRDGTQKPSRSQMIMRQITCNLGVFLLDRTPFCLQKKKRVKGPLEALVFYCWVRCSFYCWARKFCALTAPRCCKKSDYNSHPLSVKKNVFWHDLPSQAWGQPPSHKNVRWLEGHSMVGPAPRQK